VHRVRDGRLSPMMIHRILLAALPVAAIACLAPDDVAVTEAHLAFGTCPTWDCGNAATVDRGIQLSEIDASGREPGRNGVWLEGFRTADGVELHLIMQGDRIAGRRKAPGEPYPGVGALYDGSLQGAVLSVSVGPAESQDIVIDQIGWVDTARGVPRRMVPTYRFVHGPRGSRHQDMQPVCKDALTAGDIWTGESSLDAVVFGGDRYDVDAKRVIATGAAAGTWFNIGCAGSAAAKLHLLRHTESSTDATFRTMRGERQAALKMLTADYCGTGRAFTRDGEPLLFMTRRAPRFSLPQPRIEAIWSADGAVCLDEARRAAEEPDTLAAVEAECGAAGRALPACAPLLPLWQVIGHGLSANPP
jgi:hypothetical protein